MDESDAIPEEYCHLFSPGRISGLEIANRIIKSPQATSTANLDGTVNARTVEHYKRLGEGGAGLVMVEYAYVDDDASKAIHNQVGIAHREHIAGLGWLVDEVHATGACVGIQIAHGGRQKFLGTLPLKSASTSSWSEVENIEGNVPTPMTLSEIHQVVKDFGSAAARAHAARFDLVEVHAGHGYLITNFLSPFTNDRHDEYGGSFENRSRILLEIVDEIRRSVPPSFPLSVRLSVVDYEPHGIVIEETVQLCQLLESHGVDVIHCSGGHHELMEWEVSPWYMPRAPHRWGWEQIKQAVSIPVIASGSLVAPEIAEEILASGSADFVSLGRAMLADPDWARKTRTGRRREITPCIRCNDGCLHRGLSVGRSSGCSVNPLLNLEARIRIEPASRPRAVAVVGGGPAGLRSAALLHDRGHAVTLFDPHELGGALSFTRAWQSSVDLAALVDHLIYEVQRRDIKVRSVSAGSEEVADFDALVIATGAADRDAELSLEHNVRVRAARDVRLEDVDGPVVVIGGGFQGCSTALRIARQFPNISVTLVEQGVTLLTGDEVFTDLMRLPGLLIEAGVEVKLETRASEVTAQGVKVREPSGAKLIEAELTVVAVGRTHLASSLASAARERGQSSITIGSAVQPGRVFDAIHSAFFESRLL